MNETRLDDVQVQNDWVAQILIEPGEYRMIRRKKIGAHITGQIYVDPTRWVYSGLGLLFCLGLLGLGTGLGAGRRAFIEAHLLTLPSVS